MPSTPPNRVKPQSVTAQYPNGVILERQTIQNQSDQERSRHSNHHRSSNNHQHYSNHSHRQHQNPHHPLPNPPTHLPSSQPHHPQAPSNNPKRDNGIGIVREVISAKELDTLSDKLNHNTTLFDRLDSPDSIPVIPLFTPANPTDNSIDFHKNARNNANIPHYNGVVNTINYSKGIPSYHNPNLPGRKNITGDYEREDLLTMGRIQELRERMGSERVKINEKALWKQLGSEFLGTSLLLFFGIGCGMKFQDDADKPLNFTGIALCWGLTVATLAQGLGGVSCDINPAVTLANLVTGKIGLVKALMYILMQCLGSLAGVALLKAVLPDTIEGNFGVTALAVGVTPLQGCIIEIVSTFLLVFIVFSVSDENRQDVKGSVPLAIGLCVAAIVMCSGPLTGASLNPARSLGPSILVNHFDFHWVYWVGPIGGAVTAGLIYQNVFRQLRPDEVEALEAEQQLREREREAKQNGGAPGV